MTMPTLAGAARSAAPRRTDHRPGRHLRHPGKVGVGGAGYRNGFAIGRPVSGSIGSLLNQGTISAQTPGMYLELGGDVDQSGDHQTVRRREAWVDIHPGRVRQRCPDRGRCDSRREHSTRPGPTFAQRGHRLVGRRRRHAQRRHHRRSRRRGSTFRTATVDGADAGRSGGYGRWQHPERARRWAGLVREHGGRA